MKNRKYQVTVAGNLVIVTNRKTGKHEKYHIWEFVHGQMGYNPDTEKYPDYVHSSIWMQWEIQKKQEIGG